MQKRLVLVLFSLMLVWATSAIAQPKAYVEGQNYFKIDRPVAVEGDKVPVVEFFLYTCPHCYRLEPSIAQWEKDLPENVDFQRVPVLFGQAGEFYARLYYTEQALGLVDDMHQKVFNAIHKDGKNLTNIKAARNFFENYGVDGDEFEKTFNSAAVDKKLEEAKALMLAFRIQAVPAFGVAGKYFISGQSAGSNKAMLDVADFLVAEQSDNP